MTAADLLPVLTMGEPAGIDGEPTRAARLARHGRAGVVLAIDVPVRLGALACDMARRRGENARRSVA